jgi:hypothetical protein
MKSYDGFTKAIRYGVELGVEFEANIVGIGAKLDQKQRARQRGVMVG